ncbi:hypothetical protein B0O80DRAFT_84599 [Mortierella sp. GBAus27b]|nr:hypothetical protein BGX31_007359 [Mortierella sp. GBA43]KAI8352239.1 hypothetical protein B0O80DRAFT_84599 [Mortierella sp. GBAus27b]
MNYSSLNLSKLTTLLYQSSDSLEILSLNCNIAEAEGWKNDDQEDNGSRTWPSLRKLILGGLCHQSDAKAFCSWLFRRCHRAEGVTIHQANGLAQTLAEGLSTHMNNLSEISLGLAHTILTAQDVALLLSCSRKGWRKVEIVVPAHLGEPAMDSLAQHFSTLEEFSLDRCHDATGHDLVRVLASSPNLHTLSDNEEKLRMDKDFERIHANLFIDWDHEAGTLKTWACEGSLKVLKVKVTGIPRPDSVIDTGVEEAYPGEGRAIQSLVYDRLARLTGLETLWLGDHFSCRTQFCCLEMSLESGLKKLSGLKRLREVNLIGMMTNIGVKEVQWMAKEWPNLRVLTVLVFNDALDWLSEHCPQIAIHAYF